MTSTPKTRVESIDLLKGLAMIIMALDHTRDYFHSSAFLFDPTDPTQTTLPIFLTRFITHFCAPIFCFLAGTSAWFVGQRKSKRELSSFLVKRGLWLIFIEVSIVNFAWQFDFSFSVNGIAVIAMLGISMILLAGLMHIPRNYLMIFCCLVIFGHNLFDKVQMTDNMVWAIIHQQTFFTYDSGFKFYISYPIVPWFAVMAMGYTFGSYYDRTYDRTMRKKIFNIIGLCLISLFFILRFMNTYGDPVLWSPMESFDKTLMSFFQLTKYPPSLLFLLFTMGFMFLFLSNSEKLKGKVISYCTLFGRVPFFFYIIHLYIIHILTALFAKFSGFGWLLLELPDWINEIPEVKGYGYNLWVVYAVWIGIVFITFPFCKWYDRYKSGHPEKWWLSYL
ncbi:MAG TPA: heparan-alpha-glucosaminide N-acetyltransferase domain-containing protein [Saprospiraceae bacterium]|nr:heparan-alpha-glucosaminide N-acetyltransferase domain-containing protein [Saprospiraceae bacterium]